MSFLSSYFHPIIKRKVIPRSSVVLLILLVSVSVRAQPIEKCGTPNAVHEYYEKLSGKRESLAAIPLTTDSIISPSGRFMIHFNSSGNDRATSEFVSAVAGFADEAYQLEVVEMGYPKPAYSFADSMWHIYLTQMPANVYGITFPIETNKLGTSPTGLERSRAYITLDHEYSADDGYPTTGLDAARITVFHEFHHVIQFAVYGADYSSTQRQAEFVRLQEMTSTWMEVRSTPDVIDYTYYLSNYFRNIELSFPMASGTDAGYSESVFPYFITKKYGDEVMRRVWESFANDDNVVIDAYERALNSYGATFCSAYKEFGTQLFFTGTRTNASVVFEHADVFPVRTLKTRSAVIGTATDVQAVLPASLMLFVAGAGEDTSVMAVARGSDRSFNSDASIQFTSLSSYQNTYQFPETFCDTVAGFAKLDAEIFPQPYLLSEATKDEPLRFLLAEGAKRPVSDAILTIFSSDRTLIRRIERTAEPFGGSYYLSWDGKDDIGRLAPSGVYLYNLFIDGEQRTGKFVVVQRK